MIGGFSQAPFIVIWETTRACALACQHCRADAIPHRDPRELDTEAGCRLIDRVAAFGDPPPVPVLSGGDPFRRSDLTELVAHGTRRGLSVSVTPSGTGAVTEDRLRALQDAGLARLAVSLDGATSEAHDAFRGVRGSYRHTMRILHRAQALGLPLQINTTVCRQTVDELPRLVAQVEDLGPVLWALFFLVPVGRGQASQALRAAEAERVLHWAAALAARVPFGVKTTEAPHYLRVLALRRRAGIRPAPDAPARRMPDAIGRAGRAVTDGNGFAFVDHAGNICPSGFLPLAVANVRDRDLVEVYREDALFRALRDPDRLGGRCGACAYRRVCGGSRARAYAATGDPLAEDPGCAYQPSAEASGLRSPTASAVVPVRSGPGVTPAQVWTALRSVRDPEIGRSIVDLGLVLGVETTGVTVRVTMTLTTPGCPIRDLMTEWVRRTVHAIPGVDHVEVTVTLDPPWPLAGLGAG